MSKKYSYLTFLIILFTINLCFPVDVAAMEVENVLRDKKRNCTNAFEITPNTAPFSLLELPDEVLLEILNNKGAAKATGTVCTKLESLRMNATCPLFSVISNVSVFQSYLENQTPYKLRKLAMQTVDVGIAERFNPIICTLFNLDVLWIEDREFDIKIAALFAPKIGKLVNLEYLWVKACLFDDNDNQKNYLTNELGNLTKLTILKLGFEYDYNDSLVDEEAPILARALSSLTSLTHLDFGYRDFGEDDAKHLTPALSTLTDLTHLGLSRGGDCDTLCARHILFALSNLSKLRHLVLANIDYDEDMADHPSTLRKLTNLTHLELGGLFNEQGRQYLVSEIGGLTGLIHLELSFYCHEEDNIYVDRIILPPLSNFPTLKYLEISNSGGGVDEWIHTEQSIQYLASTIGHLTNLTTLNLSSNNFHNQDLMTVAPQIEKLRNLRNLTFSDNKIGDFGFEYMLASFNMLKSLKQVDLRNNPISDDLKNLPNIPTFVKTGRLFNG